MRRSTFPLFFFFYLHIFVKGDKSIAVYQVWQTLDPSTRLAHVVSSPSSFLPYVYYKIQSAIIIADNIFRDHDFALLSVTEIEQSGRILLVSASVDDLVLAPVPGKQRANVVLSGWSLEPSKYGVNVSYYLHVADADTAAVKKHVNDTLELLHSVSKFPPHFSSLGGFIVNAPEWTPNGEFQALFSWDNTLSKTSELFISNVTYPNGAVVSITPAPAVKSTVTASSVVLAQAAGTSNGTIVSVHVAPATNGQLVLQEGVLASDWAHRLHHVNSSNVCTSHHQHHPSQNGNNIPTTTDAEDAEEEFAHEIKHAAHVFADADLMCEEPTAQ